MTMSMDEGPRTLRILNLEDNRTDTELITAMLEQAGLQFEIVRAATQHEFELELDGGEFDLIVSDFTLPSYNGMVALRLAREKHPEIPFIFFSGTIGEETAVESLKNGATDYVLKIRPQRLVSAIRRALQEVKDRHLREEAEQRYRSIFENAIEGICQTTPQGRFMAAIQEFESMDLAEGKNEADTKHQSRPHRCEAGGSADPRRRDRDRLPGDLPGRRHRLR
jgi:hypothetical protein